MWCVTPNGNMEITQTMPHKACFQSYLSWKVNTRLRFWSQRSQLEGKRTFQWQGVKSGSNTFSNTLFGTKSRKFTFIICCKRENGWGRGDHSKQYLMSTALSHKELWQRWTKAKVSWEVWTNYSPNSEKDGDTLENEIQQGIMKDIQFCLDHKDRKNVPTT